MPVLFLLLVFAEHRSKTIAFIERSWLIIIVCILYYEAATCLIVRVNEPILDVFQHISSNHSASSPVKTGTDAVANA